MGDDSICHLHRDTSILDEAKYEYRNLWIPLTDTTERNGALYFVRGSHRFLTYPRPPALSWHYDYLERDLMIHKETLYSRAGDCVIFLDKTLHGSHQNLSTEYRPVIFFGVLHPDAETLYYYYDAQKKEMRAYAVGPDFYFRKDFSEPVGLPLRLTLPYDPPHIVPADMLSILESQAAH